MQIDPVCRGVGRVVDFGPGIGNRECFLLDNPDVPTSAEVRFFLTHLCRV